MGTTRVSIIYLVKILLSIVLAVLIESIFHYHLIAVTKLKDNYYFLLKETPILLSRHYCQIINKKGAQVMTSLKYWHWLRLYIVT